MHRINFRISKELLENFHEASLKAGIPKSYLLRDWINEVSIDDLYSVRTQKQGDSMTSYNFLTESVIKDQILSKAAIMNIEASEFLRKVIQNKCAFTSNIISRGIDLKYLWSRSEFGEIIDYFDNVHNVAASIDSVIQLAEAYKETGQLNKANQLLTNINYANLSKEKQLQIDLIKFHISTFQCNTLDSSVLKTKFVDILNGGKMAREYIGKVCLKLGFYYFNKDELSSSFDYSERSLEYFDIINHPVEIALAYLDLSILYALRLDLESSMRYADKAEKIALNLGNANLLVKTYYTKATNYFRNGNLLKSEEYIIKILNKDNQSLSSIDKLYVYEGIGRQALFKNNYDLAIRSFSKADRIAKTSNYNHYCASSVYSDLINYKNKKMSERKKLDFNQRANLKKYMDYTKRFLFGFDKNEKRLGISGLRELADSKIYPLVALSGRNTLNTGRLQFMR